MDAAKKPKRKQAPPRSFSDEEIADICRMYKEGTHTQGQIANLYECLTAAPIKRVLGNAGLLKPHRTWSPEEIDDIIRLYKTKSTVQIAEIHNTSYDTVRRLLQDNGVKLRSLQEASAIVMRYASNGDLDGLAADLGVDSSALYDLMVKHGFLPETS